MTSNWHHRLLAAAICGVALSSSAASAITLDFRVKLDPGSALPGTVFVQSFNASVMQGPGSYTAFTDRIEEKRSVFGSATALDNALLISLQSAYGTAYAVGFEALSVDQTILDYPGNPKSISFLSDMLDHRETILGMIGNVVEVGFLDVHLEGTAFTDDPGSPLAGFYLDTGSSLRTVLRNSHLRYTATGGTYSYDSETSTLIGITALASYAGAASFVPEPASWALLIAGFGLTGAVMRRRRYLTA